MEKQDKWNLGPRGPHGTELPLAPGYSTLGGHVKEKETFLFFVTVFLQCFSSKSTCTVTNTILIKMKF